MIVIEAAESRQAEQVSLPLSRMDYALFASLMALLLFGPLAFGAMETWSLAVLEAGGALLFLLWATQSVIAGRLSVGPNPLLAPMAAFFGVVLVQLLAGTTVYGYTTGIEARKLLLYGVLFVVATRIFSEQKLLLPFAVILAIFGAAVAMLAILQDLTAEGLLYWVRRPRFGGEIFGPYVNRNHYAGLMEMLAPFALALAMWRGFPVPKRALAGLAFVLAGGSIFLSGSRGGTIAFVAGMVFFAIVLSGRSQSRMIRWSMTGTLLALVAFLYWLEGSHLLDRFSALKVQDELSGGRLAVYSDALRKMFPVHPWMGFGLGNFALAYPQYRSFYTDVFVNEAHNDVLQVLIETGIVGFACAAWFLINLLRHGLAIPAEGRRRFDLAGMVRLAALTGCVSLLVHSFTDFNLRIPANAALFFVLAAVTTGGNHRTQGGPPRNRSADVL